MIDIQRDILPLKNVLYRLALRITLNSQEAEDVVQDVIIKIWGMGERINEIENIESFALRLTRNLSIDRQRMKINQTASYDDVKVEQGVTCGLRPRLGIDDVLFLNLRRSDDLLCGLVSLGELRAEVG